MTLLIRYVEPPPGERTGMPRGSWHARECHPQWKGPHYAGADGKRYDVTICCPDCGAQLTLSSKIHTVAADGTIHPSLVCPNDRVGCAWHVFAKLEGWPL